MNYVIALAIISHVYAIAYMMRDLKLRAYRLSVSLLVVLGAACLGVALFMTIVNARVTGRIAGELFHALWLQSLICALVSAWIAIRGERWAYLSHTVFFVALFIIIALLKALVA
jgi:hypothetical protein